VIRGRQVLPALLAGLPFLTACSVAQAENPFDPRRQASSEIGISIENQSFNDCRIHAISVSGTRLVGQVPGKATRNFTIPWRRLDDLRLRMDFLAGDTYNTNAIDVAPGDRVELVIPVDPRGAFLRRR